MPRRKIVASEPFKVDPESNCEMTPDEMVLHVARYYHEATADLTNTVEDTAGRLWLEILKAYKGDGNAIPEQIRHLIGQLQATPMFSPEPICLYKSPSGRYCGTSDHRGEYIDGKFHCRWHRFVPGNDDVVMTLTQ